MPSPRLPILGVAGLLAVCLLAASGCSKKPRVTGSKYMGDGDDAMSKGRVRRAIVCFEKEIELNPKNPAPYLKLALIYEHVRPDPGKEKYYYDQYFGLETNEAKRERVKRWREDSHDTGPLMGTWLPPPGPANGGAPDGGLLEELEGIRGKLKEAARANDEFAKRIIELEGLQEEARTSGEAADLLTKERDALKKTVQDQAESLASLGKAFEELEANYKGLDKKSSDDLARLENKVAALEARNKDLEEERSRAGRRSLSKKLDEARKALKAAATKNADYARQVKALEATVARLEAAGTPATGTERRTVTHVVKEGETLRLIALKYYGSRERWKNIYEANRSSIPDPNTIKAGQKLIIPLGNAR